MLYVGNKKTRQVHKADCTWGQAMREKNKKPFDALEMALADGYDGCCYCLKRFDRRNGYVREDVKTLMGSIAAGKLGYPEETLKNIGVKWQEGDNPSSAPQIALRSLFQFPNNSMKDEDGEVEGTGTNLNYLPSVGNEKDVLDFSADKASLKIPLNCEVLPLLFFSVRFRQPKKAGGRVLLLRGPGQLPVRVHLETANGNITVSVSMETMAAGLLVTSTAGYKLSADEWHTITVVYTQNELDIIADDKKCVSRYILFSADPTPEESDCFTIGYDPENPGLQFRGYLSSFEYDSVLKSKHRDLIEQAAKNGMGEIEYCYESVDGNTSLGKLVKQENVKGGGLCFEYEKGNIYWSPDTKACCVREPILEYYIKYGGPAGVLGYPVTQAAPGKVGEVVLQAFENGGIYCADWKTGYRHGGGITNKPLIRYREMGEDSAGIGVPYPDKFNPDDPEHPFDEKLERGFYKAHFLKIDSPAWHHSYMYYSDDSEPVLITYGPLYNYYWGDRIKEYGYPLCDETILKGSSTGKKSCFMKCEFGELYWSYSPSYDGVLNPVFLRGEFLEEYHARGGYDKLGLPVRWVTGSNVPDYCECEKGILIKYRGTFYFIDEIKFDLLEAVAGKINDGINWNFSKDLTPELSYYLTLEAKGDRRNRGQTLVSVQGDYSKSTSSRKRAFPAETKFSMKVCADSSIYFYVKYVDWDKVTKNDYLGSVRKTLNISNLWGLLENRVTADDYMLQSRVSLLLDDYGSDASKEKYATVKTTFTVGQTNGVPFRLDNTTFRSDAWWRFDNFKNRGDLSRKFVTEVFKDMEYVQSLWDKICNPLDSAFYEAAKKAGKEGNCFGMCLAAVEALYRRRGWDMPVKEYLANSGDAEYLDYDDEVREDLRMYLQECMLRQFSLASMRHIVGQFVDRKVQHPKEVLKDVKKEITRTGFSIITMLNVAHGMKGHAVLAYRVDDPENGNIAKIYVADPNYSSRYVVRDAGNNPVSDIDWIEVDKKKDTFQYYKWTKSGVVADSDYRTATSGNLNAAKLGKFDGLMYSTSYWTLAGDPTTPTLYLLGIAILGLLMLIALGPGAGGLAILGIIGMIGSDDTVEVEYEGSKASEEKNEIIPLGFSSGDAGCRFYLLTKPASGYTIRYNRKAAAGSVTQVLETRQKTYIVESEMAKGETSVMSVSKGNNLVPGLTVSGIKNKQVMMEIRSKELGAHKAEAETLRMKTDASGKAVLKLDGLTGETRIQGAAKGTISLTKQIRSRNDTIQATKLNLAANGTNEELRVLRAKGLSLKDVILERVDTKANKLIKRERLTFKDKK